MVPEGMGALLEAPSPAHTQPAIHADGPCQGEDALIENRDKRRTQARHFRMQAPPPADSQARFSTGIGGPLQSH
jgi:hypothetical protein